MCPAKAVTFSGSQSRQGNSRSLVGVLPEGDTNCHRFRDSAFVRHFSGDPCFPRDNPVAEYPANSQAHAKIAPPAARLPILQGSMKEILAAGSGATRRFAKRPWPVACTWVAESCASVPDLLARGNCPCNRVRRSRRFLALPR